MNDENDEQATHKIQALAQWQALLDDEAALLEEPDAQHGLLVEQANELHRLQLIDRHDLSDLLEQADAAYEYAVEALLQNPLNHG